MLLSVFRHTCQNSKFLIIHALSNRRDNNLINADVMNTVTAKMGEINVKVQVLEGNICVMCILLVFFLPRFANSMYL